MKLRQKGITITIVLFLLIIPALVLGFKLIRSNSDNTNVSSEINQTKHTIVATSSEHGKISPEGEIHITKGSSIDFTITPDTTYHISSLIVDNNFIEPSISYTFNNVQDDHSIYAEFAIDTFTLSYFPDDNSIIEGEQVQTIEYGSDGEKVTTIPDTGYHFVEWSDGQTENPRQDKNITKNISVTAVIEKDSAKTTNTTPSIEGKETYYIISSLAGDNGSITPTGVNKVDENSNLSFNIVPDNHYDILDVIVDGTSIGPVTTYTFSNIQADHTISATFIIEKFILTYTAGSHGSLSGDLLQIVNYGENGTAVTAIADSGYSFSSWTDNIASNPRTETNVNRNISVSAVFSMNIYVIDAFAGEGGSITPHGETSKDYNSSQSYQIEADEGYQIKDVLVDGSSVGNVDIYQFINISNNHTIEASFETIPISIVTVSSITPSSGYDTKSITIDSIAGTGFRPGASVKLTLSGEEDINCTNVIFESSTIISNALCNIASKKAEDWNVIVINNDTGTGDLENGFEVKEYEIGDIGPFGGYIFYVNGNYEIDGWKYMEAAPVDQDSEGIFTKKWWSNTSTLIGGTGTEIGSGFSNTNIIVDESSPDNNNVVGLAYNYSLNGYRDWFLPSRDELNLMYINLHSHLPNPLGGFVSSSYWSSSEIDEDNAYRQTFDGGAISSSDKDSTRRVRAVRRFTVCPIYSISYNGNGNTGGEVPIDNSTYLTGSSVTVLNENPENPLTKNGGYYFSGWNTNPDGSGTNYSAGETLTMPANDIILYAQWYTPNYTIAILPDTQSYVRWKKSVMTNQLNWLVENKDELNLKFVAHVGDIVQNWDSDPTEWSFVQTEMAKLKTAGIPYSVLPGNHDYAYMSRNSTVFNTYFPLSNYTDMYSYEGAYDENSDNMYHIFSVDKDGDLILDDKLLIISLEFGPRADVVTWANQVLAMHSDIPALIITHAYLQPDGDLLEHGDLHAASNGYGLGGDVYDGDELWDELVYPNNNVRFVFSGHDGTIDDGSAFRTSLHGDGSPVYQFMTNYQYYPVNNSGYLVLLNFTADNVSMKTYSPWSQTYKTDSESQGEFLWTPWSP